MKALFAAAIAASLLQAAVGAQAALAPGGLEPGSVAKGLRWELGGAARYDGLASVFGMSDLSFASSDFSLVAALSLSNDGKYAPAQANLAGGNLGDIYYKMEAGGIAYRAGALSLRAGRLPHLDIVDSPYSLFVNASGIATNLLEVEFENEHFLYRSRWIELNSRSTMLTETFSPGFPDRGANLKIFALKFGDMRIGFQDAAVYVNRPFDLEYFLNPLPSYFIQYSKGTGGRPWYAKSEDNSIVGGFWDWRRPDGLRFDAQVLVDDFNVFGLGGTPHNPWKAAWTLGGSVETEAGIFSFHHAGATKYAFEPTYGGAGEEYGYTYYPDTRFDVKKGSALELIPIPFEDMMIGYRHGENNLAFQADWSGSIGGFDLSGALEFLLSGSLSPANAWQEDTWHRNQGTVIFDEAVLEKRISLDLQASRRFGPVLGFCEVEAGWVFNELTLVQPAVVTDNPVQNDPNNATIWIWKPSGTGRPLFSICLGARYSLEPF
jgi:hypothetical protein